MTAYRNDYQEPERELSFKYGIPLMLERELDIHTKRYAREYEEEKRR